ncbi:hypothetical protein F4808DRAFT_412101 [Astrocystis sublimbata]|nr:hypothetical protein F4808DRAFT_412101 [Astrocystis sublimbata]
MEDNLSRARSSLYSPTMSSIDSQSTPSPPIGRPVTANGAVNNRDRRKISHGHNRISSESSIPVENRPSVPTVRSLSALGTAGGYRRPLKGSRKADNTHNRLNGASSNPSLNGASTTLKNKASWHGQDLTLEPLSEDGVFEESGTNGHGTGHETTDVHLSPSGSFSDKGLKRSASSMQMRDIKDQVNDLKGRLSTLREQARADSLKRRSLQSLRTPSPFTHARVEQWYADTSSHEDGATPPDGSHVQATPEGSPDLSVRSGSPENGVVITKDHNDPLASQPHLQDLHLDRDMLNVTDSQPVSYAETNTSPVEVDSMIDFDNIDHLRPEDGYEHDEVHDFGDSASESGASTYHDTVQAQVSHEDREDAFDYEHFFLHSAMGSMSRRRMRRRDSNDSFSSGDSVETTRAPTASHLTDVVAAKAGQRSRRGSAGSTSTMESFATATEGRNTRVGVITPGEYHDQYDGYNGTDNDAYPERFVVLPARARTHTPDTAKRMVFSPEASDSGSDPKQTRPSLQRRPQSSATVFTHRPSGSTLSIGTNRSFPLIQRSKTDRGVLTPEDSPDQGLKKISETLMDETASFCEKEDEYDGEKVAPIQMLQKEDQILVERLVASLGRCVLGLTESGRASADGRAYRRKIEAAYRVLEGFE